MFDGSLLMKQAIDGLALFNPGDLVCEFYAGDSFAL
jgi:hypothetical protein